MEIMGILCTFKLVLERKIDKEIFESSMLEFLEQAVVKNFALSDVKKQYLSTS